MVLIIPFCPTPAAYGIATLMYLIFELSGYNVIHVLANVAFATVLFLALWTQAATLMPNRAPPASPPKLELKEANIRTFVENCIHGVNTICDLIYTVGVGNDKVLIFKVLVGLYVTAQVGRLLHMFTALYLALSFAFLWPKLYTKFKREIDQAFGEANKQFEFHYSKIKEHVLGKVANEKDLVQQPGKKEE